MADQHGFPFFDKLSARIHGADTLLCVGLDPDPGNIPARYRMPGSSMTESLLAWNIAVIRDTAPFAAAFKPNIAFYEALGAAGHSLLRDTLAAIPVDLPVILDAKRGDIGSTAKAYAKAVFDELGVDAVTLSPYLGRDSVEPFLDYEGKGLFVLCRTSNPGSADFQDLEISDWRTLDREANQPLYMHVARTAASWSSRVGLVVGATFPASIAAIRETLPDTWMLIPGVGAQGGEIAATLSAGLRRDGSGLIINVSRGIATADDHAEAALRYRNELNAARRPAARTTGASERTETQSLDRLCADLFEMGAVRFGEFKLASGVTSPIYVDLRLLVSEPGVLASVAALYASILARLPVDRIAGVPYAALPIGTALALESGTPMIYPRKEAKDYGLQRGIEGNWHQGDRVAIIEDLITSGGSTIGTVDRLRAAGLVVEHAIVLIDREQGGVSNLARNGVTAHSVTTLSDLLESLVRQCKISADDADRVRRFLAESRT